MPVSGHEYAGVSRLAEQLKPVEFHDDIQSWHADQRGALARTLAALAAAVLRRLLTMCDWCATHPELEQNATTLKLADSASRASPSSAIWSLES